MTGDVVYRKTQVAWPTIVPLTLVAGIVVPVFFRNGLVAGMWIVLAVWTLTLILFSTLTVTVRSDGVVAAFGAGLVRKTLKFADVASFAPVRNTWQHGWGIHYFPGGVVYNASGLSAIEFRLASGRFVRIGTGDAEGLTAALRQAAPRQAGAAHEPSSGGFGIRNAVGIAAGCAALVFAGWALYVGFQPPLVTVSDAAITVSNGLYRNTVLFAAIRTVTLESGLPRIGMKTNGFAARNILRGNFRVDGWGSSRLYVNVDVPPFVVIDTAGTHVVVNFAEPERTRRLYAELKTRMARSTR